jgi:FkbM family methyltransferase
MLDVTVTGSRELKFLGRDLKICGRRGDPYFEGVSLENCVDDFLIKIATEFLRPHAVIADVGANIGVTSTIFSVIAPCGKIYSFEPSPSAFSCLRETLEVNKITNCYAFNLALGKEGGVFQFYDNPNSASASHLVNQGTLDEATQSVSVTTLDNFLHENAIDRLDFLKIDVEGFEMDVLAGAENVLQSMRPDVFVEFNAFTLMAFANLNPRTMIEYLVTKFPFVYQFDRGSINLIKDRASILKFLHDNIIKIGCVDDLCCSYRPLY